LIITCYHVIEDKTTKTRHNIVSIYFPSNPIKVYARVLDHYCNLELDIAFLQLQEKLPERTKPGIFSKDIIENHSFKSFGFRTSQIFNGLHTYGKIYGQVNKKIKENTYSSSLIQLDSSGIARGMSGAAVCDIETNRIIGIISEKFATLTTIDNNLALAIPIESIYKINPILINKNSELLKNSEVIINQQSSIIAQTKRVFKGEKSSFVGREEETDNILNLLRTESIISIIM
jgi:hypothetical protein